MYNTEALGDSNHAPRQFLTPKTMSSLFISYRFQVNGDFGLNSHIFPPRVRIALTDWVLLKILYWRWNSKNQNDVPIPAVKNV